MFFYTIWASIVLGWLCGVLKKFPPCPFQRAVMGKKSAPGECLLFPAASSTIDKLQYILNV